MPKSGPIIIVEDDHDDQQLLQEVFGELKVPNSLRFFDSCIGALNYLLTTIERPFLIISDINLPAMSGFDFLRKIQENQTLKNKCIPFIFLTTTSDSTMIREAYQMTARGFFVKPVTAERLKQTVDAMIYYWRMAGAPV
jgi:CheY-like chemotaxis protein